MVYKYEKIENFQIKIELKGLGAKIYSVDSSDMYDHSTLQSPIIDTTPPHPATATSKTDDKNTSPNQATSIEFEVKHFSIQLNKNSTDSTTHKLAKFKVNNVLTFIETRPAFLRATGKLGSLGIYDVSANRGLYTERFLTSGQQALDFDFFKNNGPPDYHCQREYDNALKLRMSSVKYIHTQRFISELTNYFQQFNQLQDALSRMRALSLGVGNINYGPQRSTRVKLDIQTQTPIIVIPVHSAACEALIFNLGNINIENGFLRSGDEGTLSFLKQQQQIQQKEKCLLDIIKIQFTDTNLYSAVRVKRAGSVNESFVVEEDSSLVGFSSFVFKQHSANILEKKSYLFLQLEHNLETGLSHTSPDWLVHARLNSFLFSLDLKQYILIRGRL